MRAFSKYILFPLITFFVVLSGIPASAQRQQLDSLFRVLKSEKADSNRVKTLNEVVWAYEDDQPDSALMYCDSTLLLAEQIKWKIGTAIAENSYGVLYSDRSDFPKSVKHYLNAIAAWESLDHGATAADREKYAFHKMTIYGNLGNVYKDEKQYDQALDYYLKSYAGAQHFNNLLTQARQLNNIGIIYKRRNDTASARDYYQRSLKLFEQVGNRSGEAIALGNIGNIYVSEGKRKIALEYLQRSLALKKEMKSRIGVAIALCNIGNLYIDMGDYANAKITLTHALALADSIGATIVTRDGNRFFADLDSITGDYKGSLDHYKLFIAARDSLNNQDHVKEQTKTEMQYAFNKKSAADSIRNAEEQSREKLRNEAEIRQQQLYTYGGIGGFALMLIVAIVSIRAFRNKKKANEIIAQQKMAVEEKQKEILDSIQYARRIQRSLLPNEKYIDKKLRDLK